MLFSILPLLAAVQLATAAAPHSAGAQANGQGSAAEQLLPGTKRCPDGSILRTIDKCVEMPDHRFEFTHEPARKSQTKRWWCRESPDPNEVAVTTELRRSERRRGPPTQVSSLDALMIQGRPASASLKLSIQQQIDSFHRFDAFGGRCLFVRSGGTVPVLTLHGVVMVEGELKWKHEEIQLR